MTFKTYLLAVMQQILTAFKNTKALTLTYAWRLYYRYFRKHRGLLGAISYEIFERAKDHDTQRLLHFETDRKLRAGETINSSEFQKYMSTPPELAPLKIRLYQVVFNGRRYNKGALK